MYTWHTIRNKNKNEKTTPKRKVTEERKENKTCTNKIRYIYISDIASDHHTDDDGNRAIGVSS
jgi:hypothetical protein